jgi:hypothetical protein
LLRIAAPRDDVTRTGVARLKISLLSAHTPSHLTLSLSSQDLSGRHDDSLRMVLSLVWCRFVGGLPALWAPKKRIDSTLPRCSPGVAKQTDRSRVEPTRSYGNRRRPVRSVGKWPSLARNCSCCLVSSRLGSPHHNTSDKTTYHHLLLLQTLTNPISFQPKGASAAQPTNLHHLALFLHSLGDIFPGREDADDTRYPKIDTR